MNEKNEEKNYIVKFYSNIPDDKREFTVDFKNYLRFHKFLVNFEYICGYKWFNYDCIIENGNFKGNIHLIGGYSQEFYNKLRNLIEAKNE